MMPAPLAVQLYSLRDAAAAGLAAVIERLGRIGFAGVEVAGFHDLTPAALRLAIAEAGMIVSAAHVGLPEEAAATALLDAHEALGARTLVVAYLPPAAFASPAALDAAAERLNGFHQAVRQRGMTLGYHNHWWEFAAQADGTTPHARFMARLDPGIFAEVDTYWAAVGGADPVAVVAGLGARARMLHIKDGPADDPQASMTAVGAGRMDVPAIIGVSRAEWLVVELDRTDGDMFEAIERSYAYLTAGGLACGQTE